jgi:hypothetical protein
MKNVIFVVLFVGWMFSLLVAEEIERVDFNLNGDYFEQVTTTIVFKEEIIKENTTCYKIKNKLNVPNDSLYYQQAVLNLGKEIVVYDSLKVIELFPPRVRQVKLSVWAENQEIDTNLEPLERFSWELLLFYLFSICSGFLLVLSLNSGLKFIIFIITITALCLILSMGFCGLIQFELLSPPIEVFLLIFVALIDLLFLLLCMLAVNKIINHFFYKDIIEPEGISFISVFISFLILIISSSLFVPVFNKVYLLLTLSGMYIISALITYLIIKKIEKKAERKEVEEKVKK